MSDLSFTEMFAMQRELYEKHKGEWTPREMEFARDSLLWLVGELGEVSQIIKKHGDSAVMNDPEIRDWMIEEVCDVQMYLNDFLTCYGYTPADIAEAYRKKHAHNMARTWKDESSLHA